MGSEKTIKNLNELIELDYDAIAAYQEAIDRIDTDAYKAKLSEFLDDHQRHIEELTSLVRNEGGEPAKEGDGKKILTQGKVMLADMAGDKAILKAMKTNEEETTTKYQKAVDDDHSREVQSVLEKGLADERRHKAWLEETLDKL